MVQRDALRPRESDEAVAAVQERDLRGAPPPDVSHAAECREVPEECTVRPGRDRKALHGVGRERGAAARRGQKAREHTEREKGAYILARWDLSVATVAPVSLLTMRMEWSAQATRTSLSLPQQNTRAVTCRAKAS